MELVIGLLTIIIVLDCLFLILLVLVQLPKKEAGLGQAFGGGATDALFGAGAGNVLTKLTAWCAGIFMVLALLLSILHKQEADEKVIGGGSGDTGPTGSIPGISNNGTSKQDSQKPPLNNTTGGSKSPTTDANDTTSDNGTKPQPATGNNNKPEENASEKN